MGQSDRELNPYLKSKAKLVFQAVEDVTGVSEDMLLSKNRKRYVVDARKILVNVFKNLIHMSGYQIAKEVNIDHTSVVHYEKMHKIHMLECEYRRMYSAVAGIYSIQACIDDQESLRTQFHDLQGKTKVLLHALKGQCDKLDEISEEL
jgi:hypothetical protein